MNKQPLFLQDMWESIYQQSDGTIAAPDPLFTDIVASFPPGHAADLGAGDGANALWLAERGWQVTAVDYASTALNAAAERARQNQWRLDIATGDLLAYEPKHPLDLVLFGYIHLPAEQRKLMLQRAAASLAVGGRLLYIGITDVEPPNDQVPAEIFAPLEQVVADLPTGLTIERAEQKEKEVTYDGAAHRHTGVLVLARRND